MKIKSRTIGGKELHAKVYQSIDGSFIDASNIISKYYRGPKKFDYAILNFGNSFAYLIESIIPEKKRIRVCSDNYQIVSFSSDRVQMALERLVQIVNFSSRPTVSKHMKKKYQKNIKIVAQKINQARKLGQEDTVLVPLRGGAYLVQYLDIDHKKVTAIDCKRLPLKREGSFALGMRSESDIKVSGTKKFNPDDFHHKHVRIIEACVVSGMTTIAFLIFFIYHNIKPSLVEINTIGLSQQGSELILKFAKKFGYNIKFVTGGIYYRLGDFYQSGKDELLTLNGRLIIGDIKKFLEP